MPSVTQQSCWDVHVWAITRGEEEIYSDDRQYHFDSCDATSLYRDGYWRWLFTSIRCNCPCHEIAAGEQRVAKLNRMVNVTIVVGSVSFAAIIIAAILFA